MRPPAIFRLSCRDVAIAAEAAALAIPIEVGLRCLSFDALVSRLGREGPRAPRTGAAFDVDRAARLVDALGAFYPFNATCLKKSLVLFRILNRRGIPAELKIGVRKVHGQFTAHAWIDCDERIVLGGAIAHLYTTMPLTFLGPRR